MRNFFEPFPEWIFTVPDHEGVNGIDWRTSGDLHVGDSANVQVTADGLVTALAAATGMTVVVN